MKKKTNDEFIQESKKLHGLCKIDYSICDYKNAITKVKLICLKHEEHGIFECLPNNHLSKKSGCPKCTGRMKMTYNRFIQLASKKFGAKFNYSDEVDNVIKMCDGKIASNCQKSCLDGEENSFKPIRKRKKGLKFDYTVSMIGDKVTQKQIEKRELFIRKAVAKHGNIYDYSKVVYVNTRTKVEITCLICGETFWQTPNHHVMGQGCPPCAIIIRSRKQTAKPEQFIFSAEKRHQNRYSYIKMIYINARTKIEIFCLICGKSFWQTPDSHLRGHGCPHCDKITHRYKKLKKPEEFKSLAEKRHPGKYSYIKMVYIKARIKIEIICLTCGKSFWQTPDNHLRGHGCPFCCNNNYSKMAIKWLEFLSQKNNIFIQHAENIGEFKISGTGLKADGFCEESNTIYEFHGDYFHGNPNKTKSRDINGHSKKTFGELYEKTLEREKIIRDLGYNLVVMWESEFKEIIKNVKIIEKWWKTKIKNRK